MAWSTPKTWSVGETVTAALMNTHLRDQLKFLKGLDGDIYLEDDLGVGSSTPTSNVTASTYARMLKISSSGSNENNAILLEGNRSGSDAGFGHIVGINTAATGTDKRCGIMAFLRDTDDNSGQFAIATRNAGTTSNKVWIKKDGKVGIGQSTPQGPLHVLGSYGGSMFWETDALAGSAATVIPDGTGDVVYGLTVGSMVKSSSSATPQGAWYSGSAILPSGSAYTLYSDGSNILTLSVAANGSVTVQRTAGSATYRVALWLVWL